MRLVRLVLEHSVSALGIGLVFLVVGLQCTWESADASGDATTIPPAQDFADFLAARDLVVEGTLISADELSRQRLETCGVTGMGLFAVTDIHVAVTRVWHGVADDSTLLVTVLGRPAFTSGPLAPGTRVLVWAYRDCHDGWRLWGRFCVITASGVILGQLGSDPSMFSLRNRDPLVPTTYAALDSAMGSGATAMSSTALFEGTSGVALLRLTGVTRRGAEGFTYECDSLGWVTGSATRAPRFVEFPLIPDCFTNIFVGDSLIVPVPSTFAGERLAIQGCPSAFEVRKNFAVGLGVPVPFLDYALRNEQGTLHVRPFVAKDE